MPGKSAEYRLAPEAKRDLEAIWLYTLEEWGLEHAGRQTVFNVMGECHQPDRAPSQKTSDHSPPADMKETHGFDNPVLLMNSGKWLMGHPNCILRAGTPDTILFDDEDFYWHLAGTGVEPRVVQVLPRKATDRGIATGARADNLRGGGGRRT